MNKRFNIVCLSFLVSVISACGGSGGGGGNSSPAAPTTTNEQAGTKPADFPRTFSATFRVQDNRTAEFISASSYSKSSEKSLFGCMETPDGRDFTFVMKNEDQYPDDFQIRIKNAYLRENKDQYRDLSDVALDGYTRNKYFEFNSKEQGYQLHHCEGKMERVKNYLSGFFQCMYVNAKNSSKSIDFVLQFSCDIIQRN